MTSPTPTYSTLLFDFDHTLFDSDASEAGAFAATLASHGIDDPLAYFEEYRRINRALWHGVEQGRRPDEVGVLRFEQLATSVGFDVDPTVMAATYLGELGANGDLFPDARKVLEHLCERATLAIVTNAISSVQRARLDRLDLDDYFATIVISSEVGVSKPDPAIFDIAFDRLGRPHTDATLMIGDSLSSDMRGGANAGIATCWYNPSGALRSNDHVTHEVSHLTQLASFVPPDRFG
ncbi:MAG: YjjG family noncanonical pyrimidine nucleotidase [Acidimicrobiales bacterium]